jgi:hypothetical protein
MTIHAKVRRLVLVGAVAGAVAAPSAQAAAGNYVKIGGDLVPPTQLSHYQALAGVPVGAHLVQVDGKLVRPEQVTTIQAEARQTPPRDVSVNDDGSGLSTTGLELGLAVALVLAAGLVVVVWRRGRLGTA